jgi:hypothetical protein
MRSSNEKWHRLPLYLGSGFLRSVSNRKFICLRVSVAAIVLTIVFQARLASALPTLSIQPPSTSVSPGQTFSLGVNIAGVQDLFAFQFDLSFAPGILAATNITEGSFLSGLPPAMPPPGKLGGGDPTFFIPGTIDNTAGSIAFTADSLLGPTAGVSGDGVLATVDFDALGSGSTLIDLANILLLDSQGAEIPFSIQNGSVYVGAANAVPEPAAAILLGVGLLALSIIGRQYKLRR